MYFSIFFYCLRIPYIYIMCFYHSVPSKPPVYSLTFFPTNFIHFFFFKSVSPLSSSSMWMGVRPSTRAQATHHQGSISEEIDSPSPSSHPSPIALQLGAGLCEPPQPTLGFWLAQSYVGLIHSVTATVSSWLPQPCHVENTHFDINQQLPSAHNFFTLSSTMISE